MSVPFFSHASPPLPFSSFSSHSSPNWRGVHTLQMFSVHCNVHYGPTPQPYTVSACDTFENRRFERLLKPVIVYLQRICRGTVTVIFQPCAWKVGGTVTVPPLQKVGVHVRLWLFLSLLRQSVNALLLRFLLTSIHFIHYSAFCCRYVSINSVFM